ncbi:hypothetical protein [Achromobacter phage kwar_LB4]|nr:hypothetical protein [Achromobacter phage kwar_LB4]
MVRSTLLHFRGLGGEAGWSRHCTGASSCR